MTTDEEATLRAELNGARQADAACRRERDEAHKAGYASGWFDATKHISDGLNAGPGHYPGGEHSALRAAIERDHERVESAARREQAETDFRGCLEYIAEEAPMAPSEMNEALRKRDEMVRSEARLAALEEAARYLECEWELDRPNQGFSTPAGDRVRMQVEGIRALAAGAHT